MARVDVVREVRRGNAGEWQLCFHWCRYRFDGDEIMYGFRFVWRRPEDGSIQAARGQARIPNLNQARELMEQATRAGWGDRDWERMEAAAQRLRQAGCVVDLASGYVGWPDRDAAQRGQLTEQGVEDARLLADWAH